MSTFETEEEFVVTGFVDRLSKFNEKSVIMAKDFNDAQSQGFDACGLTLNVPESEMEAERAKLFDKNEKYGEYVKLYGEAAVK